MGNLSNQYISQSFQSLLHLGSDNTASATLTEIQDALGNGVGVFVNTSGNLKVTNHISASAVSASLVNGLGSPFDFSSSVAGQLQALENVTSSLINQTGSYATTGSNTFIGNQTITGDVNINGTLTATEIHTIIESSSIIYSSGSNILGDSTSDTQTLIGLVKVSGSTFITGSTSISGSSISLKGEVSASFISSSRIVGLGNTTVSDFSQSIQQQFTDIGTYTGSNDTKWNNLEPVTASLLISQTSLNGFTASISGTNAFTASASQSLYSINQKTGSYAVTGSNTFTGSQTITGSVYGNLNNLTISSQTASMNLSTGNFFTLTLVSGSATRLEASNIKQGQTINLRITQPSVGFGTITFDSSIKQTATNPYAATTAANSVDILTFISFDSSSLYTAAIKNLI